MSVIPTPVMGSENLRFVSPKARGCVFPNEKMLFFEKFDRGNLCDHNLLLLIIFSHF